MTASKGKPKGKPRGRPIQKGQVLNPTGRPKIPEDVKEAARAHTQEAIATLAEIMRDGAAPHSARVRASESLLDRAWGRAESTVTVKTPTDVRELSTAEILAALAANGVAGAQAGADEPHPVH